MANPQPEESGVHPLIAAWDHGIAGFTEQYAALAHEIWAGWYQWMSEHWHEYHANGEHFRKRWDRQAQTPYDQLSEEEKQSDRAIAYQFLNLMIVEKKLP